MVLGFRVWGVNNSLLLRKHCSFPVVALVGTAVAANAATAHPTLP